MKTSGEFESSKDLSHYSTLEGDLDDSFFSTNRYYYFLDMETIFCEFWDL